VDAFALFRPQLRRTVQRRERFMRSWTRCRSGRIRPVQHAIRGDAGDRPENQKGEGRDGHTGAAACRRHLD
jgi:hypothetical protein